MSTDDWDAPLAELLFSWDRLSNWERNFISELTKNRRSLTDDQKEKILEIYYERVIEKVKSADR